MRLVAFVLVLALAGLACAGGPDLEATVSGESSQLPEPLAAMVNGSGSESLLILEPGWGELHMRVDRSQVCLYSIIGARVSSNELQDPWVASDQCASGSDAALRGLVIALSAPGRSTLGMLLPSRFSNREYDLSVSPEPIAIESDMNALGIEYGPGNVTANVRVSCELCGEPFEYSVEMRVEASQG